MTTFATGFTNAYGMAADSAGNLYVANQGGTTVSKVTTGGAVSTYATGLVGPQGLAFDSAGNLWVTSGSGPLYKVPSGGGAATTATNTGTNLQAAAFDSAGNLYIAAGSNLAKVTFTSPGTFGAYNGTFGTVSNGRGVAIDGSDNIFVVSQDGFVRKFTTAGGSGTQFASGLTNNPWFLTVGTVPEPASLGLLGVAAAGLLGRRRRIA